MGYLEAEKLNYIIAVRMYPNVKSEVWGLKDWIGLARGIELNEMYFNHEKGKEEEIICGQKTGGYKTGCRR